MGPGEIREFCPIDDAGHSLLRAATPALARMRRCASAHLSSEPVSQGPGASQGGFAQRIETAHLAEAVQYRPRWQV